MRFLTGIEVYLLVVAESSNLSYADDTSLLFANAVDLKNPLKVKAESEALGFMLNVSSIKIMTVGGDSNVEPFLFNGTKVGQGTQFNFLGSLITRSFYRDQETLGNGQSAIMVDF